MEWALPTIAVVVLGYAAVSRRLEGTSITAPMVFTGAGLLAGGKVRGLVEPTRAARRSSCSPRRRSRSCSSATRPGSTCARSGRSGGPGPAARHRPAADDRRRLRRGHARVRFAGLARGAAARRRPRADGRGARAGGGDVPEPPLARPAGPQRRERAQRRPLRPDLHRRARGRLDRGRAHQRDARGQAPGRADRLRHPPRRRRRRAGAAVVVLGGPTRTRDRAWLQIVPVAAPRSPTRPPPRRRLGIHRRVRRRDGLRRDPAAASAARSGT